MSALHGMQAESEIFRAGDCSRAAEEEEEDYEEYKRKMRAAAKAKAPPRQQRAKQPQEPQAASTQMALENEHEARVDARVRLEEREHRLDALTSATLGGSSVQPSEPVTADELRAELKANERAMQAESVEFVGSFGK